jgi:DNA-binding response OmpR family regulator
LREAKRLRRATAVIILTAFGESKDESTAKENGAFAYVSKDVNEKLTAHELLLGLVRKATA